MRMAALLALAVLAGCGVDGRPVPPSEAREAETEAPRTGLTISGTAGVGIAGRR